MGEQLRPIALRVAAVLGWAAMLMTALPWGPELDRDWGRIAIGVAACSTLALILRRHALSVTEVYEAGKVAGRMESERSAPDPVRHLRVVDD